MKIFKNYNLLCIILFIILQFIFVNHIYCETNQSLHKFQNGEVSDASEINDNFSLLFSRLVPIGAIIAWHKNLLPEDKHELPDGWVECNGQVLNDPDSLLDGKTIPDLNNSGRFIRGSNSSGIMQEDELKKHNHSASSKDAGAHSHSGTIANGGSHSPIAKIVASGSHTHNATTSKEPPHRHSGETSSAKSGSYVVVHEAGSMTMENHMVGFKGGASTTQHNDDDYAIAAHVHKFDTDDQGSHTHSVTLSGGTHTHNIKIEPIPNHTHSITIIPTPDHKHTIDVDYSGSSESHPKNMSVVWIMRVK